MNFKDLSLEQIIEKIETGETTKEAVFQYFLGRVEKYDNKVQAFNYVNENGLNQEDGILKGIPLAIKDIFCEKGIKTTASSKMLADFVPPYNSTVIEKLQKE
jgi:aspartyl-tRNA(Asn)/glutamyl-tRNA(Gln) amidotransferase subunit A